MYIKRDNDVCSTIENYHCMIKAVIHLIENILNSSFILVKKKNWEFREIPNIIYFFTLWNFIPT